MTNKPVTDNLCWSCSCCMEEASICAAHTSLLPDDSLKITICNDLPSGRVVGHKNITEEIWWWILFMPKTYICISYTHPSVCDLKLWQHWWFEWDMWVSISISNKLHKVSFDTKMYSAIVCQRMLSLITKPGSPRYYY